MATIDGADKLLGRFSTEEEAYNVAKMYYTKEQRDNT
jgi:hypothetical protein